jgi:hypothetical protein
MATRRVVKSVLGNFLGTYVSRYSDYHGYLLFGFLVADLGEMRINLVGEDKCDPDTPVGVAIQSAVIKFEAQRAKAGLAGTQLHEAWLTIRRLPDSVRGFVNGHLCAGFHVSFLAEAVMDNGRRHQRERVVFLAPHNPGVEFRSTRVG